MHVGNTVLPNDVYIVSAWELLTAAPVHAGTSRDLFFGVLFFSFFRLNSVFAFHSCLVMFSRHHVGTAQDPSCNMYISTPYHWSCDQKSFFFCLHIQFSWDTISDTFVCSLFLLRKIACSSLDPDPPLSIVPLRRSVVYFLGASKTLECYCRIECNSFSDILLPNFFFKYSELNPILFSISCL